MITKLATLAVLLSSLAGCSRAPGASEIAELAAVAPALLLAAPQAGIRGVVVVPASEWPLAVARLEPERVYVTADGLYVVTSSFLVTEEGLFVPRSPSFRSESGSDPSYTFAGPGVFSYRIEG